MSQDNGPTEQPQDESVRIDPEINKKIGAMRGMINAHRHQLGQLEINKHQVITEIFKLEAQAQQLMHHELERLGVAPEANWTLRPDGSLHFPELPTGPAQVAG